MKRTKFMEEQIVFALKQGDHAEIKAQARDNEDIRTKKNNKDVLEVRV